MVVKPQAVVEPLINAKKISHIIVEGDTDGLVYLSRFFL